MNISPAHALNPTLLAGTHPLADGRGSGGQGVSVQGHVKAGDLPLEALARNPALSEADKIGELSRQFEALLLRQVLAQTQKTVIKSGLTEESAESSIYQDMITNQLAECISKSGSFGLARSLEHELTRQLSGTKQKEAPVEN
jgi:Rod binding domain-containing protein